MICPQNREVRQHSLSYVLTHYWSWSWWPIVKRARKWLPPSLADEGRQQKRRGESGWTLKAVPDSDHSALLCSERLDPKQDFADIPVDKATDSEQAACNEFVIIRTFKGNVLCRSHLNGCFPRLPEVGSGRKAKANEVLCLEENWHHLKLVWDLCWKGNKSRQFQIGVYSLLTAQGYLFLRFITSF